MGDFKMPSLGADMEVGTVTEWLIKPGDHVSRGDIVAVVDTEKSTIDIEIFQTGVVDELLVGEGEEVAVGTPIARISSPGAPPATPQPGPATSGPASTVTVGPAPRVISPVVRHLADDLGVDVASIHASAPGGRVTRADVERTAGVAAGASGPGPPRPDRSAPRAGRWLRSSPRARLVAAETGIDLGHVVGSGPGGAVVEADVRQAVGHIAPTRPEPVAVGPETDGAGAGRPVTMASATAEGRQAAIRHAIGVLMARSKRDIPHYYLSNTVDMAAATAWLEKTNAERPVPSRLVLPVLMLKAVARAAIVVPEMNGFFIDDAFVPSPTVHLGVAVSMRGGGVIAPAIHDVEKLDLEELMERLRDLVGRARSGSLRSSEMSDATLTVTNLGDMGVDSVFGVIYPPQVALVGFGRVTPRPWTEGGMLGVRPCVTTTLSADHRASDGHRGGRFLSEIERLLHRPEEL